MHAVTLMYCSTLFLGGKNLLRLSLHAPNVDTAIVEDKTKG